MRSRSPCPGRRSCRPRGSRGASPGAGGSRAGTGYPAGWAGADACESASELPLQVPYCRVTAALASVAVHTATVACVTVAAELTVGILVSSASTSLCTALEDSYDQL